jgi:hypothetical protein
MLRNAINVLAIVIVVGSAGFSTGAFARGGSYGGSSDGFSGNHFGVVGGSPADGHVGYSNRDSGLRGASREYGGRDVWGHWGAYYGPMIPGIF